MKLESIPQRLLKYLKTELENPNLRYKNPPIRIGQGLETYIYKFQLENAIKEFSRNLVLRLYPENVDNMVYKEGTIQNLLNEKISFFHDIHCLDELWAPGTECGNIRYGGWC